MGKRGSETSSVTLTLLHPTRGTALQEWSFDAEAVIRIGRSGDNEVVIPNEVVSRHHAELRFAGDRWELFGLGSNGTLLDGERVTQTPLRDGQIIGLAPGGPTFRFRAGVQLPQSAAQTLYAGALPGLAIDIDEHKKRRQVSEIVESDYFQQLQKKAAELRSRKPDA
jgi:FHA domain